MKQLPGIDVRNAQRTMSISTNSLRVFAGIAIALAWQRRIVGSEIESLTGVLVSIVSDKHMAQLHKKFCGVAGPTDVLTFQHGEVIISAETAAREARRFKTSLGQELHLYLLHGLLHLCGFDDKSRRERLNMERVQQELLAVAQAHLGQCNSRQAG